MKEKEFIYVVPNLYPELVCVGATKLNGKVEDVFFLPIIAWAVFVSYNEETGSTFTWADPVTPDGDYKGFFIYNTKTREAIKPDIWSADNVDEKKLRELLQQEIDDLRKRVDAR